jgi:hypothetical protein
MPLHSFCIAHARHKQGTSKAQAFNVKILKVEAQKKI